MAEYDYIICGGGTAGCVVAARLADEVDARVLVIEAGSHNKDLENVHMVGGWSKNFDGPEDWNLETVPQTHANNRKVKLSRGRFLGGSSGVNGTLCIRGSHQDYDDWGLVGWSGEEFFAAMRKAETFRNKPWFTPAPDAHGTGGPLNIEPHDLAPISELVMESYQSMGLPYDADMFTTGETAHGCGHALRTHYKGLRTTAADFVTNEQHRDNITLVANTVVDKVNFDHSSGIPHAVSVDVVGPDDTRETFKAKREIIITGGSYCTPPILMRSGIGPRDELEKHGIDVLVESPGVGQNLMDHLIVFTFYEVAKAGLTNDYKVYHGDALASTYAQWKNEKSGFFTIFPFGSFAFARLDDRLKDDPIYQKGLQSAPEGRDPMHLTPKQPNLEWWNTEVYGGPKQYTDFPVDNKHAFAMITELFSPRSRGTVSLKSKDPHDNPVIDPNYLSHELDLLYLSEGVQMGNEIVMQGSGTKDVIKGSWPSELTHHKNTTRHDWVEHVKKEATTCYHPGGTARMGKDGDKFAVLDERLRVRGVQGLRVADCSVMPTLHQGHTQMPAYGIGGRCADFIEQARGLADVQAKGASLEKIDSVVS